MHRSKACAIAYGAFDACSFGWLHSKQLKAENLPGMGAGQKKKEGSNREVLLHLGPGILGVQLQTGPTRCVKRHAFLAVEQYTHIHSGKSCCKCCWKKWTMTTYEIRAQRPFRLLLSSSLEHQSSGTTLARDYGVKLKNYCTVTSLLARRIQKKNAIFPRSRSPLVSLCASIPHPTASIAALYGSPWHTQLHTSRSGCEAPSERIVDVFRRESPAEKLLYKLPEPPWRPSKCRRCFLGAVTPASM